MISITYHYTEDDFKADNDEGIIWEKSIYHKPIYTY